jgi:hypothetical protein
VPHKTHRIVAAVTTFVLGLAVVWFSGLLPSLERRLADWLVPIPDISLPAPESVICGVTYAEEDDEAGEVYAAVVRQMFGGGYAGQWVVINPRIGSVEQCGIDGLRDFGVADETFLDFCRNNSAHERLRPLPGLAASQAFLTPEEFSKTFDDRNGWKGFYEKYPGSNGLIGFSSVGFNRAGDEAFLYVGRGCGLLCGEGWRVLLRKGPDGWHVRKKKLTGVA